MRMHPARANVTGKPDEPARLDMAAAAAFLPRLAPQGGPADVLLHRAPRADRPPRRLLLAVGGTTPGHAAARAAAALAARHGAKVEVLSVYEPRIPYPTSPSRHALRRLEEQDRPEAEAQLARARAMLTEATSVSEAAQWPIHLAIGQASAAIVRIALESNAEAIVMGRGHGAGDEPWVYDRTVLRVALASPVPILTVHDEHMPPRKVLVAVGMDALSLRVVATVHRLFPDADVELVHVRRDGRTTTDEVHSHLHRLELSLGLPAARVTRTVLTGSPVDAVVARVQEAMPECVATGLYGATVTERAFGDNVALHLIDTAPCNLLIVPA